MSKAVADENIRKKKEEEEQKNQQVVGQQQKTQSDANKPTGSTDIPKDNRKDESKGEVPKSDNKPVMTQAKQQAQNSRRNNSTDITMQTDTATKRPDYRTYEQKVHDMHMDKLFPGTTGHNYSNSMKASNEWFTPQSQKYQARNAQNRAQTLPGVESLPTAEEFQRSQMTDEERIADMMGAVLPNNLGQQAPYEPVKASDLPQWEGLKKDTRYQPAADFKPEGLEMGNGRYDVPEDFKFDTTYKGIPGGSKAPNGFLDNAIEDPMGGIEQLPTLEEYVYAHPEDNWRLAASSDVLDQDKVRRSNLEAEGREGSAGDSFWEGVFTGSSSLGMGLINKAKAYGDVLSNLMYPETTPEEAYNRTMASNDSVANRIVGIMAQGSLRKDLETYENYIREKQDAGTLTQEDIDKYNEMREIVMRDDPIYRTKQSYGDELALNEGLAESHPVANMAGKAVPMAMQTMAGEELAGAVAEGLPALSGLGAKAADDGVQLISDVVSDTLPSAQEDIERGLSADEVLKNAAVNVGTNYAFNKGVGLIGKVGSKIFDNAAASRAAKEAAGAVDLPSLGSTADTIADVARSADVPELAEQAVRNEIPAAAQQVIKSEAPDAAAQIAKSAPMDPEAADRRFIQNVTKGGEKLDRINMVQDAAAGGELRRFGNLQEVDIADFINKDGRLNAKLDAHPEIKTATEAAHKSADQLDMEASNIMEEIYRYRNNRMAKNEVIHLGEAPEVLKEFGLGDKPLYMKQEDVRKVLAFPGDKVKHPHYVGTGAFEAIPEKLDNPVAVIRNKSKDKVDNLIVLTDLANQEGDPALVALKIYKDGNVVVENRMATMYGKANINDYLSREIGSGHVLYIDQTKSAYDKALRSLQSAPGLSSTPDVGAVETAPSNLNISPSVNNVNARDMVVEGAEMVQDNVPRTDNFVPGAEQLPGANTAVPEVPERAGAETSEALWDELSGNKPVLGEQKAAAPEYNEKGQKLSKLHSTLENTDKLTDEEKKIFADKNGFWYDPDNERQLAGQAQEAVANDIDAVYDQYAGADLDKLSGADAHKMFTASYDYSRMAQEAVKNGDKAAAELYNQKARNIMLNAREAATRGGQFNAAIRYYANTPQGVINKAYDLLDKDITKFKSGNPKLAQGIEQLAKDLSGRLKDVDVEGILTGSDEAAKESLRSQVLNTLEAMANKTNNTQLKNTIRNLSPSDVDALVASKYSGDIAKQLDMFSMGAFGVKPETLDKVLDIFDEASQYNLNSKNYYDLEQQAYTLLANDLMDGKSFRDKVDAWRYFSMLSNPLTHIRNMVGNGTNNLLTGIKNNLGAVIEAAADRVKKANGGLEGGRTKSILNALSSSDRELIKLSGTDFDDNAFRQFKQAGNKYINVERNLENAGNVWKDKGLGKLANTLSGLNEAALDAEDTLFGKAKYQTSLAGFLKANGADASIFKATDDASLELLSEAREYALKQANEATFHQSNAFANWWSQGVKSLRDSDKAGLRLLGDTANATMPFVKTPSNILASGFEYSPAEFLKLCSDVNKLKKGTIKGTDFIDDLSKTLTGTAGVGFGMILAHEGIINIGTGDENLDKFNEKKGIGHLTLKVGDHNVDISQLAPGAIPVLMGSVIYETLRNNNQGNGDAALDTAMSGLSTISNTVTDMTMLKGITDTLSAIRYSDSAFDMAAQLGTKIGSNYVSQMLPTVGGKMEKTIDDTKRTTYTDKKGLFTKPLDQQRRYLQTKIPFLQEAGENMEQSDNETIRGLGDTFTNEPQVDAWGNEVKVQDYGNGIPGLVANNFLNPFDTTTDKHDRVDDELRSLYDQTKESSVLDYGMTKSADSTVDGEKLTDKEWTQYQKGFGSLKHELAETLMDSEGYADMSADEKAEALGSLKKFAKSYTLSEMGKKAANEKTQALIDAYKEGGAAAIVDSVKSGGSAPGTIQEAAGVRSNSSAYNEIQESVDAGDTEGAEKKAEAAKELKAAGLGYSKPQQVYYDALEANPDLTVEEFAQTYKKIDANGNRDIAQKEFINYLNDNNYSEKDAQALIDSYYPKTYSKVPTLEDGSWVAKNPEKKSDEGGGTVPTTKVTVNGQTYNPDMSLSGVQRFKESQKAQSNSTAIPSVDDLPDADMSWTVTSGKKTFDLHDSKGYRKAQELGVPDETWLKMYKGVDTNGNGKNTKSEVEAYIKALDGLTKEQKADYFDMLIGTKAGNPYR